MALPPEHRTPRAVSLEAIVASTPRERLTDLPVLLRRVRFARLMSSQIIQKDLRPFPSLRLQQGVRFASELGHYKEVEKRHVLEIAAAILAEEVAQDDTANLGILFRADKDRAAIRGGDMGFREHAADRVVNLFKIIGNVAVVEAKRHGK